MGGVTVDGMGEDECMDQDVPDQDLISALEARVFGDAAGEAMLRELVRRYDEARRSSRKTVA